MWLCGVGFAYLDIIVRVPVRIVDDDGVSRGQIDAQTTSSGREEECKLGSTGSYKNRKRSKETES